MERERLSLVVGDRQMVCLLLRFHVTVGRKHMSSA